MASIGLSGVSLALGAYNMTQIKSLREAIDILEKRPQLSNDAIPSAPTELLDVEKIEPVEMADTSYVPSSSSDILDLQTKLSSLSVTVNNVSVRSTTNSSNIRIKSDELTNLDKFATEAVIAIRDRLSTNENNILGLLSSVEELDSSVSDLRVDLGSASSDISSLVSLTDTNKSSIIGIDDRLNTVDKTVSDLSDSITTNVENISNLGDNVNIIDGILADTRSSLETLYLLWNTFNSTAYVADNILQVTNLVSNTIESTMGLVANTIESKTGLVADTVCKLYSNDGQNAAFSHVSSTGTPCILQNPAGVTVVDAVKKLAVRCDGTDRLFIDESITYLDSLSNTVLRSKGIERVIIHSSGAIVINNAFGTTSTTQFARSDGNNFIFAGTGKKTSFGFGSTESIKMTEGEVTVGGTGIMSTLASLQAQIDTLKKEKISKNSDIRLLCVGKNKYLRGRSSEDMAYCDTSTKDNWSRFTLV